LIRNSYKALTNTTTNTTTNTDGLTQESLPPIIHMILFEGFQAKCKILAWQKLYVEN